MLQFSLSPVSLSLPRKLLLAGAPLAFQLLALPSQAQPDPPAQAGRLSYISGNVSYQPAGSNDWGQAVPNLPLGPGDRIFTDDNSRAEVQVGETFVRIGPDSDVSLIDSTPTGIYFGVGQGAIHLRTQELWDGQSVFVSTPSGSSTLSRPGELRVDVIPSDSATVFTNFGGYEDITAADGFEQDLTAGSALELIGSNPVQAQWLQPTGGDELDSWSRYRDQQIAQAISYRYVSREIPGAYELDAAGSWQPDTPYGAVWFPNNVAYGWAPYHNGHWVNHDPWGWVWVEDESWGYAPFHYGRWVYYNGRWGWVAGPPAAHPIWSPALVVFAGGIQFGGVGVSAWFPLGPGEAYHPWYRCSPRYIDQVNRTNIIEAPRVHVQSTYVNVNITNITYVNQTIAVTAMRHEDFAAGRPVRQVAVAVDVHQFAHVQPLAAPVPRPMAQAIVGPPPARPVPVSAARPVLINERGLAAPAAPGAHPIAPPIRPVPQFRPLAGRTVVAPPPNAKPIPTANTPAYNKPAYNTVPAAAISPVQQPRTPAGFAPRANPVPVEKSEPPAPKTVVPSAQTPAEKPAPPRYNPPPVERTVEPPPAVRPIQPAVRPPAVTHPTEEMPPPPKEEKPAPPPPSKSDKDKNKKKETPN